MSQNTILPQNIPSTSVELGYTEDDKSIRIHKIWWLFLYKLFLNSAFQPRQVYGVETNTTGFTLSATDIYSGTVETTLNLTGNLGAGANAQLPTVASLVAAIPNDFPGQSFRLRIINSSNAAFNWTITTNTGWTRSGTMTIAQNTWRDFYITLTAQTTATLQSIGTGTFS